MAKHPRKRQKKTHEQGHDAVSNKAARLDLLMDDESKDDEERRLETMLFGVKYVPKEKGKGKMRTTSDDEDEGVEALEGEGRDSGSESESGSESSSSTPSVQKVLPSRNLPKSKSKKPAWIDPSDVAPATTVSLLSGPTRLRKLRQAVDEDAITGREYETRLRAQFERINPEPSWAKKARGKGKKGEEEGSDNEAGDEMLQEGDGIKDMLASTKGLLADSKKKGRKHVVLPQGTLNLERVRDANQSVQGSGSGEVRALAFHPKPAVPVMCVATADRRIRLFHIDGHLSPLLTTLYCPSLPLVSSSSALFHPQGNSILLSGPRPFFYTYDLQQGTSTLHRRGLWGTGFDDSSILSPSSTINNGRNSKRRRRGADTTGGGGKGGGGNTENILHTAFSPATGSMLAVAGRGGNVHLVDWKSGAGQVIGSLKCTSSGGGGGGGVKGLWWVPSTGADGVLGGDAAAGHDENIWRSGRTKVVIEVPEGCSLAEVVSNGYMAIGSTSGFVNMYGSDSFSVPQYSAVIAQPKLVKTLGQLTTPISTLRFNHDAQILAMASKDKKDAMRLVSHLPSLTAFGNWPTSSTPLGHVTAVDFSARSEYIAIGNTRGRVLLYHLKTLALSYVVKWDLVQTVALCRPTTRRKQRRIE
ncbi:WD40-repeat-containing domain protein [Gymnopilus junonius]|uniref:WD40-repeat-containing domain protein n=1 Tax=Gymnopilus junonius TaxID=109634 RepID=A0A9P5TI97_GYMJU|nr:WD40-repeat-containing domain protein [Gymnopilus junonius]